MDTGFDWIWQTIRKHLMHVVVAISGCSCSGKSHLAQLLENKISQSGLTGSFVPLDSYFRDCDEPDFPTNEQGQLLFDVPESYNRTEYVQAIKLLASKELIWLPKYDMATNKRISVKGTLVIPSIRIITEGLFSIRFLQTQPYKLLKVYVDADLMETCLPRRIARDTSRYGISPEKVIRIFTNKVAPLNKQFVLAQKELADIVITNNQGGE
jgi:uridine kinase